MSYKIVQYVNKLSPTVGTALTTLGITLKSGYLRISTGATGAYVDIGANPLATANTLQIPPSSSVVLKDRVARTGIVGITTGSPTVITLASNYGNPFVVGDYVTIENGFPSGINTSHNQVTATTDSSLTISFDSTSVTGIALTNTSVARSTKISAIGQNASADVSIVEIQIASNA